MNKKITALVLIGCLALISGCKAEPLGESAYQSGVSYAITQDGVQNDGIPLPEDVFDTDSTETISPDNNSSGGKIENENENVTDTSGETNSQTENQTQTDKTTPTDNSTSSENDSSNQVDEILKNNQTVELPYDKW